jgi:DNA primase
MLAGIEEVVAPLGTALTDPQAVLVHRLAPTAYLLYDSDSAGLKATFRSGDALLGHGLAVRVVTLPPGEDPDTFVAKGGREALEAVLDASVDVFERKIQLLDRAGYFSTLARKREALDKLLPTIRITSDPLTQDLYIARTGEAAGVSRELLQRELAAPARPVREEPVAPMRARMPDRRGARPHRGAQAERELTRVMLHQRRFVESIAERIDVGQFADPAYRQIATALLRSDPDADAAEISMSLEPEAVEVLEELLAEQGGLDRPDDLIAGAIGSVLMRELDRRLLEIDRELPLADAGQMDELIREKERLVTEVNGLGRPRWKQFNPPA